MKRPSFSRGVLIAAALGLAASVITTVLVPLLGAGLVARLIIPALALTYLLTFFAGSLERTGRITALALWLLLSALLLWVSPPLPAYLLAHAGAVWLVRSLYAYAGVLPALADLALTGCSVLGAIWALSRTGSVFMATWCFFLLQALWVFIPSSLQETP
ncbi:MAG: hypothetical protein OEY08_09740, partial [Gammaproteobacteria bacterium]|nr:hypothetical protein [Gammaproteobacteria bacterium]